MINVGSAMGYLDLDTSKFKSALGIAQKELKGFGDKTLSTEDRMKSLGNGLKSIGSTMSTHVTLPLAGIGAASVATAATFEKSMSNVAALSGATGDDLQKLTDTAKHMGATTQFSATEAADALGYMALAGWDAEESTSALPGVLDLAASSGMGLAEASDLVTDYLSAFGESADQAGRMADVLAYAQANSNTTTAQLGEAFKNCAVNANGFGLDIEQTTAVLGKLADQGLKGSEAGTALSAVFRDMSSKMKDGNIQIGKTKVAITDASGNFRNLADIVADVNKATNGLSESEKTVALQSTFTADSIKAMGILMNTGSDAIAQFTDDLYSSEGAASDMAATMNDNLNGQLGLLKSALEAAAISIGEALMPVIKSAVKVINDLVDWFNNLNPTVQTTIVVVGGLAAAIGPILMVVGQMVTGLGALVGFFGKAKLAIASFGTMMKTNLISHVISFNTFLHASLIPTLTSTAVSFGAVSIPVWGVIAAIAAVIAIGYLLIKNWDTIKAKCTEVWGNIVTTVTEAWNSVATFTANMWTGIKEATINTWNNIVNFITGAWTSIINFLSPVITFVTDLISLGWQFIYNTSMTIWTSILGIITSVWEFIKSIINLGLAVIELAITVAWTAIKNVTTTIWEGIKSVIASVWNFLSPFISSSLNAIKTVMTNVWNGIKGITSTLWNGIRGVISTVWSGISSAVSSAANFVRNIVNNVWNGIQSFTSSIWNGIKNLISSVWGGIKGVVQTGANTVKSVISSVFNTLANIMTAPFRAAQNIIGGILGGITRTINSVTSGIKKVTNLFRSVPMPQEEEVEVFDPGSPYTPITSRDVPTSIAAMYYDYQKGTSSVEGVMRSNESMLKGIQEFTRGLDKVQNSQNVNTSNNINIHLNIEKMENTDNRSIEEIADQLAFYIKRRT